MSDKMREEFEVWAINNDYGLHINQNGSYGDVYAEWAWQAWQASRAAVVVELPAAFDAASEDACYYEYAYLQDEVEKALDKAGVSYK